VDIDDINKVADKIVWKALTLPKMPAISRRCGLDKAFCAFCPEQPPCAPYQDENGKWHQRKWSKYINNGRRRNENDKSIPLCDQCTPQQRREWTGDSYCQCLHRATPERLAAYKEWKKKHDSLNELTDERRKTFAKKRRKIEDRYRQGRICAYPGCNMPIADKSKSNYCRKHLRIIKGQKEGEPAE